MARIKQDREAVTLKPVVSGSEEKSFTSDQDWHALMTAYRMKYTPSFKEEDKKKKGAREELRFPSREDAILFFKSQASKGHMFLMAEYQDGKATGFHVYSCGDGELYQGTLSIIRNQLKRALEESAPDIDKRTKRGFDEITKILSLPSSAIVHEEDPGSREEESTTPTPLKKRPV